MTQKDYIKIAQVIFVVKNQSMLDAVNIVERNTINKTLDLLVSKLATILKEDNDRFDRTKFYRASLMSD